MDFIDRTLGPWGDPEPVFPGNDWSVPIRRGISYWNNSAAPVMFVEGGHGGNRVSVGERYYLQRGVNNFGTVNVRDRTNTELRSFHIDFNPIAVEHEVRVIRGNFSNIVASTMAHELGHVIGLEDNPPNLNSIMNTNRNRDILVSPTYFDAESVSIIYRY